MAPRRRATDRVEHLDYACLFEVLEGSDMRTDLCTGLVAIVMGVSSVAHCSIHGPTFVQFN